MAIYLSCALILSAAWLNASETYILSYRAQIKNAVVISESYYFSKAMQELSSHPARQLRLDNDIDTKAEIFLKRNKDAIIDFLMKEGLHTRSHEKVYDSKSTSLITITIPPTHITVDFNDDYAIITRLILD